MPEPSSAVERVAQELRTAVFDGDLESSMPLREVAIADALGVSRSTVREALGLLVSEGIAVREAHRGVSVAAPDLAAIADVTKARQVLEVAGVRRWPHASEAAKQSVLDALRDYQHAVTQEASYQELNEKHLAVHLSFVALSGSQRLSAMAQGLNSELKLALARTDRVRRNAHAQVGDHSQLVRMLLAGDIDQAATALTEHLAEGQLSIAATLGVVRSH